VALTGGLILARVAFTRIDSDVTLLSGISRLAEASEVANTRFIAAHSTVWTRVVLAIGIFDLTVDAGISFVTFTSEKNYNIV
jgi:hypothetical protein